MKKYTLLSILIVVACGISWAQQRVTGVVIGSDDGATLPGVTILEKGTTNGTVSAYDGSYSIGVSSGATLIFSFVGYKTQEIPVGTRSVIDVELPINLNELAEVVVIGYGQAKKEDLTGAVATVEAKNFNRGVLTSPQDLMVGRIAGVQVTTNSGAPGSGATIRIRGGSSLNASNDPLIVIDGFPVDNTNVTGISNPLATINPNDIESFTVLKDASATAIYGARASNGVIIITTKKGQSGKPKFSASGKVSVSTPIKYVDVLTGDEYRSLINTLYDEGFSGINDDAISKLGDANTNWQKKIFRTSISQDYNFSAAGSVGKLPYRISYGYTDQEGILKTTATKRHSIALNLNPKLLNDNLKINLSAKETFANSNFGDAGAVGSAVSYDPTQVVRTGSDQWGGYFAYVDDNGTEDTSDDVPITFVTNPVSMLALRHNVADVNRFIGNIQFDYTLPFFKDINANLNLGLDRSSTDGEDNALPGSTWTYAEYTGGNGRLINYTADNYTKLLDFYLKYTKQVGIHEVEVTGGYSWQHFHRQGTNFERNGDGTQVVADTRYKNENFLVSFFGRFNYVLNKKYLLTATVREDGSSRFSGANKWGLFPSLALGWRIVDEPFMSGVSFLSELKLRAGYGITGQQDVTDNQYPSLPVYRESTTGASYQFGDEFISTLRPSAYDANIKWEETTTYNVGLDFGFFGDRFNGALELYYRETKDLISTIPIAAGSNFSNYLTTNVGNLKNKGVELSLNGVPISKTNFTWNAGINLTHNTNEITKLTKTNDPSYVGVSVGSITGGTGNMVQIHSVGYPAYSFYMFQQVYDSGGKPIEGLYVNRTGENGDVASNELNKYHDKNPAPQLTIGINSRIEYHKFDFAFSSRISLNNYVYNNVQSGAVMSGLYVSTGYFTNIPKQAVNRGFVYPQYWSDLFVENASFFKLDNVSLGYTFNSITSLALQTRVSFTVQNALIITNYSGLDPEVQGGIDNNLYPRPRTFLLGLNVNF